MWPMYAPTLTESMLYEKVTKDPSCTSEESFSLRPSTLSPVAMNSDDVFVLFIKNTKHKTETGTQTSTSI
jgi:hypothetical protein